MLARCDKAGDATAFVVFMLDQLQQALVSFMDEFRPGRNDAQARLGAAAEHFTASAFSRKDYLALHKGISQATASRDLRGGVDAGRLHAQGHKATAHYVFVRGTS